MKRLIVNADGFGFSPGCNRGVLEAIENGIVSSVSINVNFPYAEEAIHLQERFPKISMGVHLNAIVGPPVSPPQEVRSLIDPHSGEFWGGSQFTRRLTAGWIDRGELTSELDRQIERARTWGLQVTHIDSHQNRHLHPLYFPVFLHVGRKAGIFKMRTHHYHLLCKTEGAGRFRFYATHPARFLLHQLNRWNMARARHAGFSMADRNLAFTLLPKSAKYLLENWAFALNHLPEGTSEVFIHPAYPDAVLARYATYTAPREQERILLQDPILRQIIIRQDITMISFRELA
jgi:predicted glycoside hydrolase/deacetylase ChbG (UPF0249 family)